MNENLLVVDQMLHRVVLIEQIRIQSAHHVGTDGSDHTVEDITITADTGCSIRLGTSTVRIVVAANDVNVWLSALTARMVLDQVQIRRKI